MTTNTWIWVAVATAILYVLVKFIRWRIHRGVLSKQQKQLQEINDFAVAMSRGSVDIFILDAEKKTSTTIKTGGVIKNIDERTTRSYDETWTSYIEKYVHPDDRERVQAFVQIRNVMTLLENETECSCTYRILFDGEVRNYQVTFTYLGDHRDSKIVFDFQNVDDIVLQEQERNAKLEEAMAHTLEANKARTDGLLKLTHDIRMPMNSIVGFTSLLEKNLDDRAKVKDYLSKIRQASDTLIAIFDSVQEKASIDSGQTVVSENPFSMSLIAEGKRILLAEDNDLNAEIAMAILTDVGFHVDRAVDGEECVEMLTAAATDYYNLILMDVQMPNLNGYDATRKIRNMDDPHKASLPVIAMTASALPEDRQNALDAGMDDHLCKPIDMAQMMEMLAQYLLR